MSQRAILHGKGISRAQCLNPFPAWASYEPCQSFSKIFFVGNLPLCYTLSLLPSHSWFWSANGGDTSNGCVQSANRQRSVGPAVEERVEKVERKDHTSHAWEKRKKVEKRSKTHTVNTFPYRDGKQSRLILKLAADLTSKYYKLILNLSRFATLIYQTILSIFCTYEIASFSSSVEMSLSWTSESSMASKADCKSEIRLKASFKSCCRASLVDWSRAISAS